MRRILHVVKSGHRCYNPLRKWGINAEQVRAGERKQIRNYELYYVPQIKAYMVREIHQIDDFYEFTNFDCACAKLAELGNY